jgi:Protein of unknown function (DUF4231)
MGEKLRETDCPPKPSFVLRAGVVGFESNKLDGSGIHSIKAQLVKVFAGLEQAANELLCANAAIYSDASPQIRLVSGFAEQADLVATSICPDEWIVEGVLPIQKEQYLKDFSKLTIADSDVPVEFAQCLKKASTVTQLFQQALPRKAPDRLSVYGYLLRQIDVLIYVDGTPESCNVAAPIAKKAYEGGIPVIWVSTHHKDARLVMSFDEAGRPVASDADCNEGPLIFALKPIFDGPKLSAGHLRRPPQRALIDYYRETWRSRYYPLVYDFLTRPVIGQLPRIAVAARPLAKRLLEWEPFFHAAPLAENLTERLRQILLPRYVWADALAVRYSYLYRTAYILAYLLSAVAVFVGLKGATIASDDQEAIIALIELAVILIIASLIIFGRLRFWHERWLDYRTLAESLRHGKFLAFLSEYGRIQDSSSTLHSSMPLWTLWYIRATMRELGLPSAVLDSTFQWRTLSATLAFEIDEQIKYHQEKRDVARRVDLILHWMGMACFVFILIVLSLFEVDHWYGWFQHLTTAMVNAEGAAQIGGDVHSIRPLLLVFSAGLPALGAALAGIRIHGEFERSEQQSTRAIDSLTLLKADYEAAMRREADIEETAAMLIATSRIMSDDLAAWEELFGRKRLTLPD